MNQVSIRLIQVESQQNQVMHYSFKSTPTSTFKSRTQTVTKSNQRSSIPGPGEYNVGKLLPRSATIAYTKSKRQLWKKSTDLPGPGAYQVPSYIKSGQKRSMSAKIILQPSKVPGPASYQMNTLSTKIKAPQFSMGNKSKSPQKIIQDHNNYKLSPDIYEPVSTFNKNTRVIFGSSNRKDLTQTERTPAPNYYQSEKTQSFSTLQPQCSVGSEKRQLKIAIVEETPGPASYQSTNFVESNKKYKKGFTCKQKLRDLIAQEIAKVPAPGQYQSQNLNLKSMAPRCATTSQRRLTFIDEVQSAKKDIPAFTDSQINLFNSSKYRATSACNFGKSRRRALDENQTTPGPVAYESGKLQTMHKKPSFSCPKTIPKNQFLKVMDPQNPGPGNYDPRQQIVRKQSGSFIVMRENRPNFEKERQKPGPGQYNLIPDHKPKFGWTKEKRISFTDMKNQAKHGTHYNLNTNITNPPSYMHVTSKIQFSPTKSHFASTGF